MQASSLGDLLARETGVELSPRGQVIVDPNLTVQDHPEVIVIGDLACFTHQVERPLPGVAPVAMQMGRYAAKLILSRQKGTGLPPFKYVNKGNLAVIGRNAAVAGLGRLRFSGFAAWLAWVFVHIAYLIEFDNKLRVLFRWGWNYLTRKRGAHLFTGPDPFPIIHPSSQDDPKPQKWNPTK